MIDDTAFMPVVRCVCDRERIISRDKVGVKQQSICPWCLCAAYWEEGKPKCVVNGKVLILEIVKDGVR
jgi:hypothetical protein